MFRHGLAGVLCVLFALSAIPAQVGAEQHVRSNPAPGPDPNQPDPNRPEPIQPDPNQPEPTRPDPNQPDPNRPQPPQPPAPEPALSVFVAVNGTTTGPFDRDQLTAMIARHELDGSTLVWMDGFANWVPASTVPQLKPLLAAAPPKPKFDSAAYLAGTWEASGTVPIQGIGRGQFSSTTTYNSDGTIVVYMLVVAQTGFRPIQQVITGQGTYQVETKTDTTFILTPDMQLSSRVGDGPAQPVKSNTPVLYTIIDQNTMSDPAGIIHRRTGS